MVDNYKNINKITEDIENDNNIKIKDNHKENGMAIKDLKEEFNKNKYSKNNNKLRNKAQNFLPNQKTKTSDEENKKLIEENLLLKKKILKLEADKIKNNLGQNIKLPNKYKKENLNSNFKQAQELLDKLNVLMDKMENEPETKRYKKTKRILII